MKEIHEKKEISNLREYINKTFKTVDPFGQSGKIYQESLTDKLILCPIYGYQLDESQYDALIKTCRRMGIDKICFSEVEGYDSINLTESELVGKYLNHYYEIDLVAQAQNSFYNEYLKMELILENAIYTENGSFGVLISHEEHAVLGATKEFVDMFKLLYPQWSECRRNFEDMWNNYSKTNNTVKNWYGNLVKYIYE